jgi:hypothetical protein
MGAKSFFLFRTAFGKSRFIVSNHLPLPLTK